MPRPRLTMLPSISAPESRTKHEPAVLAVPPGHPRSPAARNAAGLPTAPPNVGLGLLLAWVLLASWTAVSEAGPRYFTDLWGPSGFITSDTKTTPPAMITGSHHYDGHTNQYYLWGYTAKSDQNTIDLVASGATYNTYGGGGEWRLSANWRWDDVVFTCQDGRAQVNAGLRIRVKGEARGFSYTYNFIPSGSVELWLGHPQYLYTQGVWRAASNNAYPDNTCLTSDPYTCSPNSPGPQSVGVFAGSAGDVLDQTVTFLMSEPPSPLVATGTPVVVAPAFTLVLNLLDERAAGVFSSSDGGGISLPTDGPVFDLPEGCTCNSQQMGLVNNRLGPVDSGPPVVTAPADASYQCAAQVPAAAAEQASATDDQGVTSLTVAETGNGGAGSPASPLVLTRTWSATDAAGNSASDSQTITVIDDTAPVLALPADLAATVGPGIELCADVRLALEAGTATATDNCSDPTVTLSGHPEGSLFPVGETLLQWTATDAAGNVASGTQRVVVTCPVGSVVGTASLLCNGQAAPAEGVTVRLLHEGSPFRSTSTGPAGEWRFDDVRLGTYTVSIDTPPGYAVAPSTQVVGLDQAEESADPFLFTCLLSDLTGIVLGTCDGQTSGLQGVTVDVFREDSGGMDVLVATTGTDAAGSYRFDDLPLGGYTVGFVLPLGYTTASGSQAVTLATADGSLAAEAFSLTCQPIAAQPRSMGYWKHQVNVYLTGKGHAQETLADLLRYVDELVVHFNQNLINPVVVYMPGATETNDKLLQLQQLLTVNRGGTTLDRAKQQLLALMLNVVSGKIAQTEEISDNGANVSQAITHGYDLIVDGDPATDETAWNICGLINDGQRVPSGMVPASTRLITYDRNPAPREQSPVAFGLGPIAPNPATLDATITFSLPSELPASLEVVDLAGRMVSRLEVGARGAGTHTFRLGELTAMRPGVYMVRLTQGAVSLTRRLAVIR